MTAAAPRRRRWQAFHEKFLVEERYVPASTRRRYYLIAVVLVLLGVIGFSAILIDILQKDGISTLDVPVENMLLAGRSETVTVVMIVLAIVFGPIALPVIILVLTVGWGIFAKHAWRPVLLALGMLSGVVLAQVIAPLVGRQRPPVDLMLFGADTTFSFPSGHVLGAADFLLVGAYLLVSRRNKFSFGVLAFALAAVGIAAAAVSRVYLGYHWTTDALASIAISLVVVGAVIALDTRRTIRIRATTQNSESSHEPATLLPGKRRQAH